MLGLPIFAAFLWRLLREIANSPSWQTWVFSEHADDGPYVVVLRAMFGFEDGVYLRQNLANAFIVNYLWLPTILALITLVMIVRRRSAARLQRPAALLVGLAAIYAWTTLTYPTFTEPRYATPVIVFTLLVVMIGLSLWPRRAQPFIIGALMLVFVAGAWSPTDPISRKIWGTTSVGGEQIYDTAERQRGPDRMNINFATLNASERINARLRRIYASGATLVAGDCNAMKFGEKLAAVGDLRSAFDRGLPGARPLRCVFPADLPPDAANGPEKIALVRTPEEDATRPAAGRQRPLDRRHPLMTATKWPKQLPVLTDEQERVRDDFMAYWHEVLPNRYGVIERFNHGWPAKTARPGERTLEIGAGPRRAPERRAGVRAQRLRGGRAAAGDGRDDPRAPPRRGGRDRRLPGAAAVRGRLVRPRAGDPRARAPARPARGAGRDPPAAQAGRALRGRDPVRGRARVLAGAAHQRAADLREALRDELPLLHRERAHQRARARSWRSCGRCSPCAAAATSRSWSR